MSCHRNVRILAIGFLTLLAAGCQRQEPAAVEAPATEETQSPTSVAWVDADRIIAADRVIPDEATGCAAEDASWFTLRVGAPDERAGFVCDDTSACFVEPEFQGLEMATPGACGEVLLRWFPAASHCANGEIRYDVHRGAAADFSPTSANRVAAGIAASSWTDTLLTPGRTYYYLVRAIDSRSGPETNARTVAAQAPAFSGPIRRVSPPASNTRLGS